MCGIIGATNNIDITLGMKALKHRGKDFSSQIEFGNFNLGHHRLSIIDLDQRSNQPFLNKNTALVYNGEIWNYLSLKRELKEEGYKFRTTSDTEVVSTMVEKWGVPALKSLNGMFAFAWTDGERLLLARDKFGEVPLYYHLEPFAFASEQKALVAMGLRENYLLPAGHCLVYHSGEVQNIHKYYSVPEKKVSPDINVLRSLLHRAVQEREIADVPICTLLSGGIDSSMVTVLLKERFKNITAYTAVFNERSKDLKIARKLASDFGIRLIEVKIPPPSREEIERTIHCIENPLKTQVEIAYPCIKLAERISADGFKVTFSGDGSDEMFAGYRFAYYAIKKKGYTTAVREMYESLSRKNFVRNNLAFMAHSVEVRLPFANTDLVEYALNLGEEVYNPKEEKLVLKEALRGLLPNYVVDRQKIGFQDGLGIKDAFKSVCSPQEYKKTYKEFFGSCQKELAF